MKVRIFRILKRASLLIAAVAIASAALFPQTLVYAGPTIWEVPRGHPMASVSHGMQEVIADANDLRLIPVHLRFDYTANLTRAELAALMTTLFENLKDRPIPGRADFSDTDDENVRKMGYIGVVSGWGDGQFVPHRDVTREEAAAMLTRLANALGMPLPDASRFPMDISQASVWARDSIGRVMSAGLMLGETRDLFNPHGTFSREDGIAAMLRLYRLYMYG